MARIRTVKPGFWTDEDLSSLPPEAHMLAAALLNYADDEGYFNANPKLVKAACCPLREDSVSTHECLNMLERARFISLFRGTDGKAYGHIRKFCEHQKINRPTTSKIRDLTPPDDGSVITHGVFSDGSLPEGKGREQGNTCAGTSGAGRERDYLWEAVLSACGVESKKPTSSERGAWNKAVKEIRDAGGSPDEVQSRADRYRSIYPNATLTPNALARHWSQCKPPAPPRRISLEEAARIAERGSH